MTIYMTDFMTEKRRFFVAVPLCFQLKNHRSEFVGLRRIARVFYQI